MKRALCAFAALLAIAGASLAQSVSLQGMMGNKALLIVDGAAPRMVAPGETHKGVKVLSTSGEQAVVEIDGRRHTLHVGDGPASVGGTGRAPTGGSRVVLTADTGGHFISQGSINGRAANFVVDTGATMVSMGAADADRLGIEFRKTGQLGRSSTANGVVPVWKVKLDSVRIGDVEIYNVDGVVSPSSMPYVLLGNSFLSRFQLTQGNGQMTLEKRY